MDKPGRYSTLQKAYAEAARKSYEKEGVIEFDRNPVVSESEEGAYVQAWVWVGKEDL